MAVMQANPKLVDQLGQELDQFVNQQLETPEFRLLLSTPLTPARARLFAGQMVFYGLNRRDCWAHVAARAPLDVKQAIWHHEQDELIYDARGDADHTTLMTQEARLLGMSEDELARSEPLPMARAALYAWLHLASTLPWLGGLTASHFLERRNNGAIVRGGGLTERWRAKMLRELGLGQERIPSSNVHAVADEEHSDLIWEAIARHVTDERAYQDALAGARECAAIDRAYRGALAYALREID